MERCPAAAWARARPVRLRRYWRGLPLIAYSPLILANVCGAVGYDFGGTRVEGAVRLGAASGMEVRASFPIR
ncbi:hypothetical protein [Deinococcus hopiensis]|uniref:hypothetical protein n=1 Tax=Deinococcus hopiensis TaxID=309885 RepID=UPI0009FE3893|nr:hypothetical protein [Deinococcus hopiensis]